MTQHRQLQDRRIASFICANWSCEIDPTWNWVLWGGQVFTYSATLFNTKFICNQQLQFDNSAIYGCNKQVQSGHCLLDTFPSNIIICPRICPVHQNRKILGISLQSIATAAATVNINFVCQHFWRQLCGGARATARLKLCKKGIADGESENKKSDSELESKKKGEIYYFLRQLCGGARLKLCRKGIASMHAGTLWFSLTLNIGINIA